jgi:single-stranded-DNA-specific exonuclease
MEWVKREPVWEYSDYDSPLEQIAKIRGIENLDRFLNPQKDELFNPYLMRNIEIARDIVVEAIMKKQKICISMDCDPDGITSGVVLYKYLKNYTDFVDYIYVERSVSHGLDVQIKHYKILAEDDKETKEFKNKMMSIVNEADLIIAVDSSTNDIEMCQQLKDMGKTIVVLDHHQVDVDKNCAILVNPQHPLCLYPNKDLSGVGVVFKVIQTIEDEMINLDLGIVDPFKFVDLVALGMISDVMRVDGLENRYIMTLGLKNIRNTGFLRILKGASINQYKVKGTDIAFSVTPLLNATMRMDNIKTAIDMLLEDDDNICKKLRLKMVKLREEMQQKAKRLTAEYEPTIDHSKKIIIALGEFESKGMNGLICQQLASKYKKPCVVGRITKESVSGSFRSVDGFNLNEFLQKFDKDIKVLGHEQSGGIVVATELLPELVRYIEENMPKLEDKSQVIEYDLSINVNEIPNYIDTIMQFNYLVGNGFPNIIFKVDGITIEERKVIGDTRETVKFHTMTEEKLDLIRFRVDENYANDLDVFDSVSVIGVLTLNNWFNFKTKQNIITNQIILQDYKKSL